MKFVYFMSLGAQGASATISRHACHGLLRHAATGNAGRMAAGFDATIRYLMRTGQGCSMAIRAEAVPRHR